MHAEVDRVLGGRLPTMDDIPNLPYTRMVLSEAMRLCPPVYAIGRQAVEDYEVRGYVLPAGWTVFLSQYVMHRDSRYWFDAERFDPNRWTPEAQARRPKFTYFPFSAGPRVHLRGFRLDRGHPRAGHPRPALAGPPGSRPPRHARATDYPPA